MAVQTWRREVAPSNFDIGDRSDFVVVVVANPSLSRSQGGSEQIPVMRAE
jgi:hypothetical protein